MESTSKDNPLELSLNDISLDINKIKLSNPSDSENSANEENSEDSDSESRSRPITSKLSIHLKGLMGEANLRCARGDVETAIKMCFEVIRQAREAYEPYMTLAQIYEHIDFEKYKSYLTLAAYLCPSNSTLWIRLAELPDNSITESISFINRAINADPKNIALHQNKIELLKKKGDHKAVLKAKQRMAIKASKRHYEEIMQICMEIAKEQYELKSYPLAVEMLRIPFKRFPDRVTKDVLNMMLEVLLASNKLSEVLDYFTQYCGFTFDILVTEERQIHLNAFEPPENLQVDLKMKFIQCVVRLKTSHLIPTLINSMLIEDDVEEVGDLYLDVVDALMACDYPEEALKLLVALVKSKNFSLAAVWLKYAECLNACQMFDQAIDAYFTVMNLAPQHVEVLYPLAMLLLKQNRKEEGLRILSQDLSNNKIDVPVLIEQLKLLKEIGDFESYFACAELLLSRHCVVLKYPEELKIVATKEFPPEKIRKLKAMRVFRKDEEEVESNLISVREPKIEDEYEVYKQILQVAKDQRDYLTLQKFCFMGLISKRFLRFFQEIYYLAFISCIYNRDYYHGYTLAREIVANNFDNNLAWNWFTLVMQTPDDVRHCRFLEKYKKSHAAPSILETNYNISVGGYLQGLSFYMKHYKRNKTSFGAFMIAFLMTQIYSLRSTDKKKKKNLAEIATYLFMNYAKIRSSDAKHEVYYNMGRMYHQLGINYLAEHYYKLVLNFNNEYTESNILGLKEEAAFNLYILYKNVGNKRAARDVVMKYIVV